MSQQELHKKQSEEESASLILNRIKLGSILQILGKTYTVTGKALYDEGAHPCHKIFLSDNHLIIFTYANDSSISFGKYVEDILYVPPFPHYIEYNNKTFELNWHEHQKLNDMVFGKVEAECEFWDYISGNETLSLGIMDDTCKRLDVLSKSINTDSIKIISE
jgi:hypothetical protein